MRSKEKVTPRTEILKNFTREFLIEEKRRCEKDRYVCDFRILIHKRPHENHNYLSRLLQDYTTMFLSHERISANKMNQEDLKYQVKTQLASRKKQTPKQRYVKSKLSEKSDNISEHQSYLVLKAQTEEFLKTLRNYEELEQIAYEIFIKNTNSVSKTYQYEMEDIIQPNTVLKLKSSEVPQDIPYKKHYRNVYVVNSPAATGGNSVVNKKIQNQNSESKSLLENYEHIKKETELFLQNNKNYNDAEQKMLTEQYRTNSYIRKYVDSLTSSEKPKKSTQTPKKGLYSKIRNMMGFSPENPTKFYKNVENTSGALLDNTEIFLANERKYNNFEFEAYKLFYIKNEEFRNPLIEKIKNNAYESEKEPSGSARKIKIKHLVGLKNAKTNQRNPEKDEFEDFNLVKCSPNEIIEPEQKIRDITFQFDAETPKIGSENYTITNVSSTNEQEQVLQQFTADFLKRQKIYEDKQRYFYVIHLRRHNINLKKEKKETLLLKIKHLFFGRHEKSKENLNYSKEITREFLRNEQYFYGLQKQAHHIFSEYGSNYSVLRLRPFEVNSSKSLTNERIIPNEPKKSTKNNESHQRSSVETAIEKKNLREPQTPTKKDKNKSIGKSGTLKKQEKSKMSVTPLHQRSQSEDLLMFRTKTKSLDNRKSPTGHKTFSDRLKSMVGITNRRKTKSRENILSLTDPVHYFLEHERFYYEGVPQNGEKYGRSVSAIESTPKDGTLKTKTRRFLSTENVLYQDSNSSSIGKPPTGRRRKQERNRDSKEKRRSRTLSPAQKLVSKIRNLVQKSPDKKKEDPAVIAAQTDKFLSDHRTFNDVLGASFSYTKLKDEPSNIDDTVQTTYIAEKSPSSNKILPPSRDETKVKSPHQMQNKATSPIIPLNSIKDSEDINEKSNISKDYQHIKTKTEEFVHDIKRYHDLDKNPDAMDKTLIFINNKSDYTPVVTQHIENTPGRQKTVLVKSMNVETVNDHSTLKTEQQTEFENTQSNSSFTNNNTQKIIQNSYVQQTRITQRVTTEKVQRKTTKEIFSREIDSKNINGNTQSTLSSENEHTYENVTISGVTQKNKIPLISENEIISTGKVEDRTIFSGDLINAATNLSIRELKTENEEVNDHAYENVVFTAPTEYKELVTPKSEDYRFNTIIEIEEKVDNRKKIEILDPKRSDSHKVMSIKEKSVQKEKHTEISNLSGKKKRTDEVKRNSELQNLKSQKAAQSKIIPPSRPNRRVENSIAPQHFSKSKDASDDQKNKIIRDQTDEFLRKHQYLIHKEEVVLPKVQALSVVDNQKISVETAPKQSSAPKRIEKSPEKEQKPKKTAFSKLKTFVSGTSKRPTAEETNILLRQQTSEFLDNVRKSHDESEEANAKYRVEWLSDQQNKPSKAHSSIIEESKPVTLTEDEKKKLRLIRQNTDIFLKDHQDYHNKQRSEDNAFFTKMGQPETFIWLSSRPIKKGDNIITKVKNLMSPQKTKKNITAADDQKNKIIRDQTDEFLRKHQYLIHKEEVVLPKVQALSVVDNQKISVETAPKQSSAPKRIEKSPEKEQKPKKTAFSKLKTFVSGTSKKPTAEETNILLRQQTSDFLDNVRKSHDESEEANAKYRVVWLSDQQNKPSKAQASIIEESKPITLTEDEKKKLRLIRQNTDIFLKDHQDYHNKLHTENSKTLIKTRTVSEDAFVTPITKSPDDSKLKEIIKVVPLTKVDSEDSIKNNEKRLPSTSRKNIVSKVKDIISPHKSSGAVFYYDIRNEIAGKNEDSKLSEQKKEPVKCLESEEYLCPPPRHIKKVTFSQKKEMEEQSDNIPRGDYSTGSFDAIKPQAAPRKQIAKKVKTMFIDSAEIFKQNKESNLIPETDKFLKDHKSHQNKQWAQHSINNKQVENSEEDPVHLINKPESTLRKEHIGYSSKITQPNTLETRLDKTYAEKRRMLVLFLDDHKAHHEKERNQFINFISKQNKTGEYERKTTGKEPKLKNKLMSKFKSLVGQSQENIASDTTRQNEIALRKQTSEFLISQKCYNDLECNAHNKFSLKQLEMEKLHKIHTAGDQLIPDAPEKLSSNSKLSFQEDSTFSTRKLSLNGSPETTSSQKPLKSSPVKKISMTDDTTVINIIDSQTNDNTGTIHKSPSTDYISSLEHNINFLNDQRNYINSENETWRRYLKYEPVKVLKATNDTREEYTKKSSRVQYSIPKQKDPPRKSSSQIESEKIDHEVTLHQTKLFMENHKSFHDNLQNELSKYVPKETKMNYCEETVLGKDQGVLTKIKSLITLGPTKSRSYEVNKPAVSTQKYTNIQINEMNESGNIAQPSKEIDNDFREITKNFLEDHQEYHNQQRLYSTDTIRQGEEKEKKNKKGVFSKIKSYMVGDTNKKTSKTSSNAPTTIKHSNEMVQTVPITEAEVLIRELESSPRTSRRNRPRNIQYEELQISKREPNDSKISSNIVPVETRENVNPSSLKPHQTTALEGMEADDMNKSLSKNLYYDEIKVLPKEERKKFAKDKINTQDFLLNEKRFTEIVGSKIEHDTIQYQKDSVVQNTVTGEDIPSIESNITDTLGVMTRNQDEKQIKTRAEHQPSAPSLNELSGGEKENKQPVIQRLVKPMSPTKTIFKEIREREESPDRKVYVMKEGYIITKGNTDDIKSTKNDFERKAVQRKTLSSSFGDRPRMEDQHFYERGEKKSGNLESHIDGSSIPDSNKTTEGQDYVDRSNDSPSRSVPQGDLEVRRHHTKNCYFIFIVVLVVLIAIYCLREDENNN